MKTMLSEQLAALGRCTVIFLALTAASAFGQSEEAASPASQGAAEETSPAVTAENAVLTAEVGDETGRIVIEAKGLHHKVPLLFSAHAEETVRIEPSGVVYEIDLRAKAVQGEVATLSLEIGGAGTVESVSGEGLHAWSVRRVGEERFLDLEVQPGADQAEFQFVVRARSAEKDVPGSVELFHLKSGKAVGFTSTVKVDTVPELTSRLVAAEGFLPLETGPGGERRFEGSLGQRLVFDVMRSSAVAAPVEIRDLRLEGTVNTEGASATFLIRGAAEVTKDGATVDILRGRAALAELPGEAGYEISLTNENGEASYELRFPKAGSYPLELRIVAGLEKNADWRRLSFQVPAGAVVPVVLNGIPEASEFEANSSVIPSWEAERWRGFLPVQGRCDVAWKPVRKAGEGKLFFSTTGLVNVGVGAGILRQTTVIEYNVLQGELPALTLDLSGPGEVLEVEGPNVVGLSLSGEEPDRQLEVRLSQPIESSNSLRIRSQLALDAFPVRVEPLRLVPAGTIRHSGYIRIYNVGATRLEVVNASGLTQLSPDQFPEQNLPGGDRQVFAYRFPAAEHGFEIAADRVQPEVNVAQVVVYELSESERTIRADVELEIREAPLRDWSFLMPADGYSVISVQGAEVADHVVGTQVDNGMRTLKVLFAKEVMGRQLVKVHLEKNETVLAGAWTLPVLRNPDAKNVRGEIGVASVPGFRIGVSATDMLTEIPLSRFQSSRPDLQQAFRIRERDWSATMQVERLPQSVQADVFHLYSLKDQTAYVSVVLNYFITGAPVSEFRLEIPDHLVRDDNGSLTVAGNLSVVGKDVRQRRISDDGERDLVITLQKGAVGPQTLLITYQEALGANGEDDGTVSEIHPGEVAPKGVRGERGFIQVVSPVQVNATVTEVSESLLKLDPLELPAEFRLLGSAPPLATYQYSGAARPFDFTMKVDWFEAGDTVEQVVEFMEASTRVARDGQVVTNVVMMVKNRGRRILQTELPNGSRPWEVTVDGQRVNPRTDTESDGSRSRTYTLIPLPPGADPNAPVRVQLRIGKPEQRGESKYPVLTLPAIHAPVLKAEWVIEGEPERVLIPRHTRLQLDEPVVTESGLEWIADYAVGATIALLLLLASSIWLRGIREANLWTNLAGITVLVIALGVALVLMDAAGENQRGYLKTLKFTLPVIAPGEQPTMVVANLTEWGARISLWGILAVVAGVALVIWSFIAGEWRRAARLGGSALVAVGLLMQGGGATLFYLLVAILTALLLLPWLYRWIKQCQRDYRAWSEARKAARPSKGEPQNTDDKEGGSEGPLPGPSTTAVLLFALVLSIGTGSPADAQDGNEQQPQSATVIAEGLHGAGLISQNWIIEEGVLRATGTLRVSGERGDSFLLLRASAVLTSFQGEGLRLAKREVAGAGPSYVISIGKTAEDGSVESREGTYTGSFSFQMQVGEDFARIPVPTGPAAVQDVQVRYDQAGWQFESNAAMRVTDLEDLPEGTSGAHLLLAPRGAAEILRRPRARDVKAEETQFFAEVANLFLPSPGVIDGIHRIAVRPSRGEVSELALTIPEGFTVSEVGPGPVGTWQFDAETRKLTVVVEPAQAQPFSVTVQTQSSLPPLPADVTVGPPAVLDSAGEVGLLALAFGTEAQPETTEPDGLSAVNLTDFDQSMIPKRGDATAVLHRVYRYGQEGGSLALRVSPVAAEVRVGSEQVLSLGDERMVLGVTFTVEITRAGVFQISFPLPAGLEIDSLSSPALSHWTELSENDVRFIIMHLNGKTMGRHQFNLALSGPAPAPGSEDWLVPQFQIREAQRHTGTLAVQPSTGIRLETVSQRNVSDVDPRELGAQGEGSLAFRLLQADYELRLAVSRDQPWITGDILHEVGLREGQTKMKMFGDLLVERASIRTLLVRLPGLTPEEQGTLRAGGAAVSDLVKVEGDVADDLWELQFKRRVVGPVQVRIEWERTGTREEDRETLLAPSFPEMDHTASYTAVRAGARLELTTDDLPTGWQRVDWNTVPAALRESGDRSIPRLMLRRASGDEAVVLRVRRHSVAEVLKLRVTRGVFTTVVSPVGEPLGEQLTSVDLNIEVIQRSTLQVSLPENGELLNVFVNGESVGLVRVDDAYQFYILPGMDGRSARVEFVYSAPAKDFPRLDLNSPKLNVPLENIDWRVIVPASYDLVNHSGDLDFREDAIGEEYDLQRYLVKVDKSRARERQLAEQSMERANSALGAGEQTTARMLLNSVANNYAVDAATNEDARVKLNNLQERQAMVALNTRRQRLYLDNRADDPSFQANAQLELAATRNPIVNRGDLSFRPQEYMQFLEGNSEDDNRTLRQIAAALVSHQRATEAAPQAIKITMPDEGRIYTFSRSVQVESNAPLELSLKFQSPGFRNTSREALVLVLVFGICLALVMAWRRRPSA